MFAAEYASNRPEDGNENQVKISIERSALLGAVYLIGSVGRKAGFTGHYTATKSKLSVGTVKETAGAGNIDVKTHNFCSRSMLLASTSDKNMCWR